MPKSRSQVYNRYLRGREVGHRRSLCLSRDPLTAVGGGRKGVLASAVVERLYRDGCSDVGSILAQLYLVFSVGLVCNFVR